MGESKEKKTSRQDEERDRRQGRTTCFIRKFCITETPGNFSLEVCFTAKNASRNVYEQEHRVSLLNFMESLVSEGFLCYVYTFVSYNEGMETSNEKKGKNLRVKEGREFCISREPFLLE
jgi:hypothetical protein